MESRNLVCRYSCPGARDKGGPFIESATWVGKGLGCMQEQVAWKVVGDIKGGFWWSWSRIWKAILREVC